MLRMRGNAVEHQRPLDTQIYEEHVVETFLLVVLLLYSLGGGLYMGIQRCERKK
jgi:hypothetical protein